MTRRLSDPAARLNPSDPELAQQLYNLEAEQGLLGAILFDNAMFASIVALDPGHFYDPAHQRLWDIMSAKIRAGGVADATTMRAEVVAAGFLAELGGARYLLDLMANAARLSIHIKSYANLIRDLAARREIRSLIIEGMAQVIDPAVEPASALADLEMRLRKVDLGGASAALTLPEAAEQFLDDLERGPRGLGTGLVDLDARLGGLMEQELIIIAGRPGMGKTALLNNILRHNARAGKKVHAASYEMSAKSIAARALSDASHRDPSVMSTAYSDLRRSAVDERGRRRYDVAELRALAKGLPAMVVDDCPAQTLAQLDASVRQTRRRLGGLDLIAVDYLQLMVASRDKGNRVGEITEISQGLKALAKRYDVPVIALSQLSRQVETRDDKRPVLADLRESGSIEQDADMVLFCYREAYYLAREEPKIDQFFPKDGVSSDEQFNIALAEWEARMRACERKMEVGTGKLRSGQVGSDLVLFLDKYDHAADWPK